MKSLTFNVLIVGDKDDKSFKRCKEFGERFLAEFYIVSNVFLLEIPGAKFQKIPYRADLPVRFKFVQQ